MTLTLYRTQKLLIQGVGANCGSLQNFKKLSFMFNQSENQNLITDGVNEQTPSRKQPTIVHETPFHGSFPPKYNKNSSSRLGIFSKLFSLHQTILMPIVVCMMLAQYLARRGTNNEFQHQRTTKIKCKTATKKKKKKKKKKKSYIC